jgi:hypothetical protein
VIGDGESEVDSMERESVQEISKGSVSSETNNALVLNALIITPANTGQCDTDHSLRDVQGNLSQIECKMAGELSDRFF